MTEGECIDLFRHVMGMNKQRDGGIVNEETLEWLQEIGFFYKPAAIKYHGNYEGGLFDHSYDVAKALQNFTDGIPVRWQAKRSALLVGMLHDVCKCDDYIKVDGVWKYNPDPISREHGAKSVLMLKEHIMLTDEEATCIRYHMGAYETDAWDQYDAAIRRFPAVLFTHTADMFTSKVNGV